MTDYVSQYRFLGRNSVQIAYFNAFKGHIRNPGMGVVSMAVSDHMTTGYTPEARAAADLEKPFELTREMLKEVTALGYIDNLYIRVGWNDVQREKGRLALSPAFEMSVEAAEEAGLSWGFRIMQASPSGPARHEIPEFLAERLPLHPYYNGQTYGPRPKMLPLYTDEYLKYWGEMLMLLGERFDRDPALEYGDMSGFGLWGEGHHGCNVSPGVWEVLELDPPEKKEQIIHTLIENHLAAFPSTPMVLNQIFAEYEAGREAIANGCWVRRDSYYGWFEARQAEAGLLRRGDAAMIFETVMPGIDIQDDDDPSFRHSFMEAPEKMCDYGAHYGIIGFNPPDTLYTDHMTPQLFSSFKNRVGYRLRPSVVWKIRSRGDGWSLVLGMVNDGCANPPGDLTFYAESNGRKSSVSVNGACFEGRMHLVELPLPNGYGDTVHLSMSLKIGGKIRPVRFAADVRAAEAPYKLRVSLNHGSK